MIDICALLKDLLEDNWVETNPASETLHWVYDEFDPNACYPQILFEALPAKFIFITRNIYRVEQTISISIYLRPVNYLQATIDALKTTFLNMKTQIESTINLNRFILGGGVYSIELTNWVDGDVTVGRDIKKIQTEPIEFSSKLTIKTVCYEGDFEGGD